MRVDALPRPHCVVIELGILSLEFDMHFLFEFLTKTPFGCDLAHRIFHVS